MSRRIGSKKGLDLTSLRCPSVTRIDSFHHARLSIHSHLHLSSGQSSHKSNERMVGLLGCQWNKRRGDSIQESEGGEGEIKWRGLTRRHPVCRGEGESFAQLLQCGRGEG